ncbi:hypothetical protein AB1283_00710 [Bacillus sp. S13(2024)]|uniref:hypothetical protein n=1 Tax=Bacillus sp. S13(2024) TaxID=3162885 RepID=UPI003D22F7E7
MENNNQESKNKIMLQIPDEIIRNSWFYLDDQSFCTYGLLKHSLFRSFNEGNELQIDHNKLKHKLHIGDNRTLKKIFKALHQNQIVMEHITAFPRKGSIALTLDPLTDKSNSFTQLPVSLFGKSEHIGVTGIRLLYYYESYINRKDTLTRQYAFPSIETTSADLKLNHNTIITYNKLLKKHRLLKIVKHVLEEDAYDDEYNVQYIKYNNHYFVRTENM